MDEMDFSGIDDSLDESTVVFHRKRPTLMVLSSSTEVNDIYDWKEKNDETTEWKQVTGRRSLIYQYMEEEEFLDANVNCNDPFSLHQLFLSDNLLELIVKETNKYEGPHILFRSILGPQESRGNDVVNVIKAYLLDEVELLLQKNRKGLQRFADFAKLSPYNKTIADVSHRWYTPPDEPFACESPVHAVLNVLNKRTKKFQTFNCFYTARERSTRSKLITNNLICLSHLVYTTATITTATTSTIATTTTITTIFATIICIDICIHRLTVIA
ncbi:hypothetical protein GQX74_009975 [Glossina fuscipes]|nr:hypothetical protein GQX74_009975 [Glossina fuscipes]